MSPFGAVRPGSWYGLTADAGLGEWVTPHTLRRSVASHLPTLEDAREMLGHSSAAITARSYRDPRVSERPAARLFDPRASWWRRIVGW